MPDPDQILFVATFAAAIGSGLIAGVFFAFSTFIMKALGRISPAEGMAAMQSINIAVINPLFLGVFLGTAAICVVAAGRAAMRWDQPGSGYVLAGSALYVLGSFLVTMFFNVPLNDSLAKLATSDPDAAGQWANYVNRWTKWNHVRTIASLAAMAAFIMAMR